MKLWTGNSSILSDSTSIYSVTGSVTVSHSRSDVRGSGSGAMVGISTSIAVGSSIVPGAGTQFAGSSGCCSVSQGGSGLGTGSGDEMDRGYNLSRHGRIAFLHLSPCMSGRST